MKISYNWLKQIVPSLTKTPQEVAESLSRSIAEIESVSASGEDYILEVENKALNHRSDLFGHLGWGREVAAVYNKPYLPSVPSEHPTIGTLVTKPELSISIDVPAPHSRRYVGAVIENTSVVQSPAWLIDTLSSLDQRSINYLIDVTNYIMQKYAQPMHVFDRDKLPSQNISVRFAKENESITLLDDTKLTLTSKDLVIDSGGKPIALAGIKGGKVAQIDETTTNIVLESAHFDMYTVRATSRRHGIRSDASLRFEKGLNPCVAIEAMNEAITLITGTPADKQQGIRDEFPRPIKTKDTVKLSLETIKYYLNTPGRSDKDIVERLLALGFETVQKKDALEITIPSIRNDVSIAEDLYEEIGRVYDYNNTVPTLPERISTPAPRNEEWEFSFRIRELLARLGLSEVLSYTFVDSNSAGQVSNIDNGSMNVEQRFTPDKVHIANPLAPEMAYVRTSLIPSIATITKENAKRFSDFSLFEIGRVTIPHPQSLPEEPKLLCISYYSQTKTQEETLLFTKSLWRSFLEQLNITNELVNTIPFMLDLNGTSGYAYTYEIDVEMLYSLEEPKTFIPIPVSMPTMQDLSFIISEDQPVGDVINEIIEQANIFDEDISASITITDRFQSEAMKKNKTTSVTVRITFSHLEKSLSDSEVTPIREQISQTLVDTFGATIR